MTDQDLSKKGCVLQKRTAYQLSSRTAQNHMNQAEAVANTKAHNLNEPDRFSLSQHIYGAHLRCATVNKLRTRFYDTHYRLISFALNHVFHMIYLYPVSDDQGTSARNSISSARTLISDFNIKTPRNALKGSFRKRCGRGRLSCFGKL